MSSPLWPATAKPALSPAPKAVWGRLLGKNRLRHLLDSVKNENTYANQLKSREKFLKEVEDEENKLEKKENFVVKNL